MGAHVGADMGTEAEAEAAEAGVHTPPGRDWKAGVWGWGAKELNLASLFCIVVLGASRSGCTHKHQEFRERATTKDLQKIFLNMRVQNEQIKKASQDKI